MQGVSFLIPARNEKYLETTIRDILKNCRGDIEVLVALDGYIPNPQIVINDNRVVFYHYQESVGHRRCVNDLAKNAKYKYICKIDAHCSIGEGFDIIMMNDCKYDETHIARMYNLDIHTWQPKLHKRTDYMYISSPKEEKPFRASYYTGDEYKRWHRKEELIDDTMCCMGPCFFMHKDRFLELGGCDENHIGGWGQQGVEVSLKAWLSGGALKVNKKTWFAHWFRGDVGFPYQISGNQIERARAYSRDLWLNNKWEKATRTIEWLVNKFNPPTWEKKYPHILKKTNVSVVYYSSNKEPPEFEKKITDELVKQSNGLPIISVSQKPMQVGTNICMGELPFSEKSLYLQILKGLQSTDTEFCLAAESDFIYPPEYFKFVPPTNNHVYRYTNVWVRWLKHKKFYKKYYSEGCQICGRQYWIDMINRALDNDVPPKELFPTKTEYRWSSVNPAVSFKTNNGLHYKTILDRTTFPAVTLPYWGDCKEFV